MTRYEDGFLATLVKAMNDADDTVIQPTVLTSSRFNSYNKQFNRFKTLYRLSLTDYIVGKYENYTDLQESITERLRQIETRFYRRITNETYYPYNRGCNSWRNG